MTLLELSEKFPDEQSCRTHFKLVRDKTGIVCKKCSGTIHYWQQNKEQYQCRSCSTRTTLRSGTVMEASNMSFRKWYIAMLFVSVMKKGFSTLEIQRQMGRKRYQPVWEIVHKLCAVMGKRDDMYLFDDMVEFDGGN